MIRNSKSPFGSARFWSLVIILLLIGTGMWFRSQRQVVYNQPTNNLISQEEAKEIIPELKSEEKKLVQNDLDRIIQDADFVLPKHSKNDVSIIKHNGFVLKYNEEHEQADWVAYQLTSQEVMGTVKRSNDFLADPSVKTFSATPQDYKNSGYDRGHLAPAGDMKWSHQSMNNCFLMSNISPQKREFNGGIWEHLESLMRKWAKAEKAIFIVTGPVLKDGIDGKIGDKNKISIPKYFYKVVLDMEQPDIKGIGFILANEFGDKPLKEYAVSIDEVERRTGFDFFPMLPDDLENKLEAEKDVKKWRFYSRNR